MATIRSPRSCAGSIASPRSRCAASSSIHAESGRDLVDLLLNGRYIEREELTVLYERLVLDVLHEVISWEDGVYSFANGNPPESALPVSLSTESMLMEAVRRTDEMRRYHATLSDPSLVLGLKELPDPDAALSEEEKELFGLVDGRRTLGELVAEAPLNEYEALEALFRLVEAGMDRDPGAPRPRGRRPARRRDDPPRIRRDVAPRRDPRRGCARARDRDAGGGPERAPPPRFPRPATPTPRWRWPTSVSRSTCTARSTVAIRSSSTSSSPAGGSTRQQTRVDGRPMTYVPTAGGAAYTLELSPRSR